MKFAKSAASVDLGNGEALALLIGAAAPTGVRLIDNQQSSFSYNGAAAIGQNLFGVEPPLAGPADCIDTQHYVAFNLDLIIEYSTASIPAGGFGVTAEIVLAWYVEQGGGLVFSSSEIIEMIPGPYPQVCHINNKTKARYLTVSVNNWYATALTVPTAAATLNLSNTPTDHLSIGGTADDGLMLNNVGGLASGASSGTFAIDVGTGIAAASLSVGPAPTPTASMQLLVGFGAKGAAFRSADFRLAAGAVVSTQLWTFPLPNRPLFVQVNNKGGGSGTVPYSVALWRSGD